MMMINIIMKIMNDDDIYDDDVEDDDDDNDDDDLYQFTGYIQSVL